MTTKTIEQLARTIDLIIQLPEGDALVQIIGNGEQNNNQQALEYWISQQADLLELEPGNERLMRCVDRLKERLESVYEYVVAS